MKLEIRQGSKVIELTVAKEEESLSLLDILQRHQISVKADCGGIGRCGKCRVQFLQEAPAVKEVEKNIISKEDLEAGWRLACITKAYDGAIIYVPEINEDSMAVQVGYVPQNTTLEGTSDTSMTKTSGEAETVMTQDSCYGVAVDIGTTTVAISLVNLTTKQTLDTYTTVNHQRRWGADVIARIKSAGEGFLSDMMESIRGDLRKGIEHLLEQNGLGTDVLTKIVIAGNTTMGHLFCGFPCESLGVAPYTPVDISTIRRNASEVFGWEDSKAEVILLPGISTYVGADITAGMYVTGMHETEEVSLLVDLGTNGEMAIGNKDSFLVTSTAAGPAFEGGNISCGVAGIPGAICHVQFEGDQIHTETIGNKTPVGLCGTGVIETVYELQKNEWIDETGLLEEDYFEDGVSLAKDANGEDIIFWQQDVREIQLAKSAVRAGLECLLLKFGVTYEDVAHVYIAGGFGYKMDLSKAAGIGMLPKELLPKMQAVGNSSLGGAMAGLLGAQAVEEMEQIVAKSEEVSLAMSKEFNDFYMDYMMFEEE